MGETYGQLPTDVLRRRPGDFWMNAHIWAATEAFKDDVSEGGSPRATEQELRDLDAAQTDRAAAAEAHGTGQPAIQEQLQAMREGAGGR